LAAARTKCGGSAAIVDSEYSFDPDYAKRLGVDLSRTVVARPRTHAEGYDMLEMLLNDPRFQMVVVDSVPALHSTSPNDGHFETTLQLRLPEWTRLTAVNRKLLILVNHVEFEDPRPLFGDPLQSRGGPALRHFISTSLRLTHVGHINGGLNGDIGSRIRITAQKSRTFSGRRGIDVPFLFGRGFGEADDPQTLANLRRYDESRYLPSLDSQMYTAANAG